MRTRWVTPRLVVGLVLVACLVVVKVCLAPDDRRRALTSRRAVTKAMTMTMKERCGSGCSTLMTDGSRCYRRPWIGIAASGGTVGWAVVLQGVCDTPAFACRTPMCPRETKGEGA
jgi:hypothetical protein